jgi:myo-inositol 2-dehydrogenase / D-chiro-inositol 1-dehydrogenase
MTVRVGIIGVGIMGADHARTIVSHVPGASLRAIYDADSERAKEIAAECGAETVAASPEALINDKTIDAVLIATPDATHGALATACIAARKPVLCEKPLAPTGKECLEVIAAEVKAGKQLVQIGYMRRFDPAYVEMKAAWKSGKLGQPLMFHCVHRNVSVPDWFTADMAIANSAVHEFDIARWVLESDLTTARVFAPAAKTPGVVVTPVFLVLTSASGQLVNIEIFNNATYGYDVRGELVCEKGTVSLRSPVHSETSLALGQNIPYPADWRPRFADAYRLQNQAWIRAIAADKLADGANAWDGYAANAVAEAGVASLAAGRTVEIKMGEQPKLYRAAS